MSENEKKYICIDLKSFYASCECVKRKLDPLTTNLVVADISRTEKTICLAVSPSLKKLGIPGRPRLFEVVQKVKQINEERRKNNRNKDFIGKGVDINLLNQFKGLELDYIIATPHMSDYIKTSSKIYGIYLKYISSEDIHVYSIDEVFMDVTNYLKNLKMSAHELAMTMIRDVLKETGITATAGIGTNMYLAKVSMDIVAKHIKADKDGVRIAFLDEYSYRKELWNHQPLTDFWRVGKGYQKRLNRLGLYTMGDVAKCSLGDDDDFYNENLLFKEFGVNAELLIDHAWGYEPTTIKDIKAYKPSCNSLSIGQVLHCPYQNKEAKTIVVEMADNLSMSLLEKKKVTKEIELSIFYDIKNLETDIKDEYEGEIVSDYLGRLVPKPSTGKLVLHDYTSSTKELINGFINLFDSISIKELYIRKFRVVALNIIDEDKVIRNKERQISLFEDFIESEKIDEMEEDDRKKEKQVQEALLKIKSRYGKNSILKAVDYKNEATGKERNEEIGGHKA